MMLYAKVFAIVELLLFLNTNILAEKEEDIKYVINFYILTLSNFIFYVIFSSNNYNSESDIFLWLIYIHNSSLYWLCEFFLFVKYL